MPQDMLCRVTSSLTFGNNFLKNFILDKNDWGGLNPQTFRLQWQSNVFPTYLSWFLLKVCISCNLYSILLYVNLKIYLTDWTHHILKNFILNIKLESILHNISCGISKIMENVKTSISNVVPSILFLNKSK